MLVSLLRGNLETVVTSKEIKERAKEMIKKVIRGREKMARLKLENVFTIIWSSEKGPLQMEKLETENPYENNVAHEVEKQPTFYIVMSVTDCSVSDQWIMDFGCSFHMCHNKSWFKDLVPSSDEQVYFGNNNTCTVTGIGSVTLKTVDERFVTLTKVKHVHGLRRNLISSGTLDNVGCK